MNMHRIPLMKADFTPITEGVHVFKITDVTSNDDFGSLKLTLTTKNGARHFENYRFLNNDGTDNEKAIKSFSFLARAVMPGAEEVNVDELKGKYVKTCIAFREYTDKEGKVKKASCKADDSYWETPTQEEINTYEGVTDNYDIDDIFG